MHELDAQRPLESIAVEGLESWVSIAASSSQRRTVIQSVSESDSPM